MDAVLEEGRQPHDEQSPEHRTGDRRKTADDSDRHDLQGRGGVEPLGGELLHEPDE